MTTKIIDFKSSFLINLKEKDQNSHSKIVAFIECFKIENATSGRYSLFFLLDLFFSFEDGFLNPHAVIHEINYLERKEAATKAKKASKFNGSLLKGLWHKHYYDGSIPALAHNVKNALNEYGSPYSEQMIKDAKASGEERFFGVSDIAPIVDELVIGNLRRRNDEGKMTGEWIVYVCYQGVNYYLCQGRHNEGDESIRKKIDSLCILEFPFLKEILS